MANECFREAMDSVNECYDRFVESLNAPETRSIKIKVGELSIRRQGPESRWTLFIDDQPYRCVGAEKKVAMLPLLEGLGGAMEAKIAKITADAHEAVIQFNRRFNPVEASKS